MDILIKNGIIVNDGLSEVGSLLITGNTIGKIIYLSGYSDEKSYNDAVEELEKCAEKTVDAAGKYVMPGVIDDQVHFREPGNTHKATIGSESKAAVLGGVTSYMDMPNNSPAVTDLETLEKKYAIAEESSFANYSFYLGATNENIDQIKAINPANVCGVKVFMGSSTGNMLVSDPQTLKQIFKESPVLIATHCEDEQTIKENLEASREKYNDNIPFNQHPVIRSRQACIKCTSKALDLALENNSKLHILHMSTADELEMLAKAQQTNPKISGEVCVHYMWFNRNDYDKYGSKVKCNPAIKEESDMIAIRKAVKEGVIKVVATDHAPHLKEEKEQNYLSAPSGLPLVQHSLQVMLELHKHGVFTIEEVAARMSHGPADLFEIKGRGYLREGYFADVIIVDTNCPDSHSANNPAYKCGWSPFEGYTFSSSILHTFVNGTQVVADGALTGERNSARLLFNR